MKLAMELRCYLVKPKTMSLLNSLFRTILFSSFCFFYNFSFSQHENHDHSHENDAALSQHLGKVDSIVDAFINDNEFLTEFDRRHRFRYSSFIDVNSYFVHLFKRRIADNIPMGNYSISDIKVKFLNLVSEFKLKDELWFETPSNHGVDVIYYGKHGFNPIPKGDEDNSGTPKTLLCQNSGFESSNWSGWETICATATNAALTVTNMQTYNPPGGCTSPTNSPQQHSLWTTGNDPIGNFPRVFEGGVSAMLGNGPNAYINNVAPQYQAAALRKTFVVDPNNTLITYSYAAVLLIGGANNHTNNTQPFFRVRVLIDGADYPCAAYSATAGDGQAGWVTSGSNVYRDWTTIAIPLQAYIGSTVTLEFYVSDCYVASGSHYAYAYVDVSCGNMEIEPFCQGTTTVLTAPTEGISSYVWNTGATTPQISISTPGNYSVTIRPYGSTCTSVLNYNATLFPVPNASFTPEYTSICVNGDLDITNTSTIDAGGTITSYQWSFGDGISTPASTGTISGVAQTVGTYTNPTHEYTTLGDRTVRLIIESADGCRDTTQSVISVVQGPQAAIVGAGPVCVGDASPQVTFTGSQIAGPFTFTYNVNDGPDQTVTTVSGNSVTVPVPTTSSGTYNYEVTNVSTTSAGLCDSPASGSVNIVVNPLPTATIAGTATVCQGAASQTVTFTGANGTAGYRFTYSLNGGASQTITSSGSTATITVPTTASGTFTYTLQGVEDVATGCDQPQTGTATIIVNPLPTATISGTTTVCQGDASQTITFTGANSSSEYEFTYSLNGGASQTITTSGSNTATITVPTTAAGTFTYTLQGVEDVTTGCGQPQTGTATVTVNPLPTATIAGTATVCQGAASQTVTFTGANGTAGYRFTYSLNGGASQTITSSGSTATITVPTTASGTFTYTLLAVEDVATGCDQPQTGTATIIVNPLPTATISGTTTVCQGDASQTITFTGANSSSEYEFTYSLNGGASQTITTSGSNTATIAVPTTAAGTFTYTLQGVEDVTTGCGQPQTGTATVTVNPLPTATIAGTTTVCQGDASQTITFTGANGSSEYEFTYSLNGGANQTITTSGSNTVTITVPTTASGTFTYTLLAVEDVTTGCGQPQTGSATITVNPLPNATIAGTIVVCQEDTEPVITFTGTNSSDEYTFTYSLNGGTNQTLTTSGTNIATVNVPTTTAGTFTYELINVEDPATGCNQDVNETQTVTVNPLPTATIAGTTTVCQGDASQTITFTGANGSSEYEFTYSLNGGANQTITTSGSNTVTITVPTTASGTFTYTLLAVEDVTTGCGQPQTGSATITVNPLPDATIAGTIVVCQEDTEPVITFTGTNSSDEYTFTYSLNGGANQTLTTSGTNIATVNVPTTTAGTFTYELINVEDPATGCNQDVNETQTVTVNPLPTATIAGTTTVCQGDASQTITFTGANGSSEYEFTYSLNGGANQTITTSGSNTVTITVPTTAFGTFTYTLLAVEDVTTGCGQLQTGSATITVNPLPDATIAGTIVVCQEDTEPVITFTGTNSSDEYTFTYSLNGAANQTLTTSGTNIATVNVPTTTAGTFTYELINVEDPATGCNQDVNETQTVTVNPLPTATIAGTTTVCQGDASQTITFTGANGSSEYEFTYSLNGGANQTITTSGSNTVTITVPTTAFGIFTYTLLAVEDVTTGCGQLQTGSATITVNPLPDATIAGTIVVCQEDTEPVITFTGTNSSDEYTFTYSLNGAANQTLTTSGTNIATVNVPTTTAGTFTYELINVEDPATGCNQDVNETQTVTVNPLPTATIAGTTTVCQGDASQTITFTGANGSSEYEFTYSLNGGANQTITTSGSNTVTITVPTTAFGTFTYTLLAVEDVTTGCGQPQTGSATITVNPLPDATIAGTIVVCQEDTEPVITFTGTNSSDEYTFTYSLNGAANQTLTTSGTNIATVNVPTTTAGTFTYELINVEDPATGCNQDVNETQTITVNPLPTATIAGTTTVCQGDASQTITFTGANGSSEYEFTYSLNGGANQTITTSGSNTVTITVPTTASGTFTYTLLAVEDVTTGCGQPQTGSATITVNPLPDATIAGTIVVCQEDTEPVITFTGTNSSDEYTFTYSLNGGTNQTLTTSGTNIATVNVPTTTAGTFTYELINVEDPATGCNQDVNETQTVTVNPLPTATIAGTTTVCQGDASQTITFTGANGSSEYEFTYSLNGGANQTITTSGSNTVTITVPTTASGTFTYTLLAVEDVTTGCGQLQTGSATITVNPLPDATIAGTIVVCQEDTEPVITFTGTNSSDEYTFTYSLNGAANQTLTTSGTNIATVNVPTTTAGTFTYELINVEDPATGCNQDVNETQTITVNPLPTATIAGTTTVCQGDASQTITFTGANGSSEYEFTYSLNGGANQTITTSGSNTVTITVPTTASGTFTYTLLAVEDVTTGCGQPQTGSATITVNPLPDATIAGTIVVCQEDTEPVITFTGTNSSDEYTFTYSLNGGANQTLTTSGTNIATVNVPTTTAGTFTYELINVEDPATGCNQDVNETQTVTVNPLPTATIAGTTTVCQGDASQTITFTGANGSSEYEFTYSLNGGANQTITTSGSNTVTITVPTTASGTFTYTLLAVEDVTTGCGQPQTGSATIVVNLMPNASMNGSINVCQNDANPSITFNGLTGPGDYGFNYTVNGGPVQTATTSAGGTSVSITQSTSVPGTYVYNLVNVFYPATGCDQDLNLTETIVVNQLPVASISAPDEACHMDPVLPQVQFTGSNGTTPYTFTYTVNGGPNQTITSAGSVASFQVPTTTPGTYVYTITYIEEGSVLGCNQVQNLSTMITIHALPQVSAGNDFSSCEGSSVILSGAGAVSYVWNNGVLDGVPFTPTDTVTYTVIGTDINGCRDTNQVTVNVVPTPTMGIVGQNVYGCAPLTATFTNTSIGNLTNCTWYFGNGQVLQGCDSVTTVFENAGCFDVTLTVNTPEGCTNTLTLDDYVCVESTPDANFYPNPSELTSYNWESQMVNQSNGADYYLWNFGDGSPNSSEVSPVHSFPNESSGLYTVMLVAYTNAGCTDTAYATVTLTEELLFYVPNTFTPDGDQYNNEFIPVFTAGFDPYNYSLMIFNRWGELIFESRDATVGWKGFYGVDGKMCQDGTYTWKIDVKGNQSSNRKTYVGHVNLIR
jgi:gliding motility-associated-like protein